VKITIAALLLAKRYVDVNPGHSAKLSKSRVRNDFAEDSARFSEFCITHFIYLVYFDLESDKVKDFKQSKDALNKELEQFIVILDELLPRYTFLLEKKNISPAEVTELGEIEHYLIQVNAQITAIKEMLEEDLYGHSLEIYFQLKIRASQGDPVAEAKFKRMRSSFEEALRSGAFINWN
jgi:hypothetical protein